VQVLAVAIGRLVLRVLVRVARKFWDEVRRSVVIPSYRQSLSKDHMAMTLVFL